MAMKHLDRLMHSEALRTTVLSRLVVGAVFLSEGIQKFLEPAMLLGSNFLLIIGAEPWSRDGEIERRKRP